MVLHSNFQKIENALVRNKINGRKPFKLILNIDTPVVIKDFAPTLDGLLFDAVRTRHPNNSVEDNLTILEGLLSVTSGLFHASSAQMAVSLGVGVVANEVTRIRSSGHRNLSSDWFSPNYEGGDTFAKAGWEMFFLQQIPCAYRRYG